MKKFVVKLMVVTFIINCLCTNIMFSVSANDYDVVQAAVEKAENSSSQKDIDDAQVLIAGLEPGSEREALEIRIDAVQEKSEYILKADFSDRKVGDEIQKWGGWDLTVQEDPDNPGSLVAKQVYNENSVGNFYDGYPLVNPPVTGRVVIEQSIKFDGDMGDDRYFSSYYSVGGDNADYRLFEIWPAGCKSLRASYGTSDWNEISLRSEIVSGKWYDIAVTIDTIKNEYALEVRCEGTVIGKVDGVVPYDKFDHSKGIDRIRVRFSGKKSSNHNDAAYINGVRIKGEGINEARKAVVEAERSNLQDDVDEALDALTNIGEGEDKTALTNRLNNVINIIESETLVSSAEKSRKQTDFDAAKTLVDGLFEGYKKREFTARLDAIVILTPAVAATEAVEKAEKTQADEDIQAAENKISVLEEGILKSELQKRIDSLKLLTGAVKALEIAEKSMNSEDFKNAKTAIELLEDGETKSELMDRLEAITNNAVLKAQSSRIKKYVDDAYNLVNLLPDGDEKTRLLEILDVIVVRGGLDDAVQAVEKAERTRLENDIAEAQELINELEESDTKDELQSRINKIKEILDATQKVEKAEESMTMADAEKALIAVNALSQGDEKDLLYNRVNTVINEIVNKINIAEEEVRKAGETLSDDDIAAAKSEVNALDDGIQKDKLVQKIELAEARKEAIEAVADMENSKTQSSLNKAQKLVMQLPAGDEKQELTDRILAVQLGNNSVFYVDYEDRDIGSIVTANYDMTVQNDPQNENNKVAKLKFADEPLAGFGESFAVSDPLTGDITFECDFMFEGNVSYDRYASFYARRKSDNYGIMMFQLNPDENNGGLYVEFFEEIEQSNKTMQKVQTSATYANDKWYTIKMVLHTETEKYDVYIYDTVKDAQIGAIENLNLRDMDTADYTKGFSEFYYRMSGSSTEKNCNMYMDNMNVYVSGTAAELVIKAESTKDAADIEAAKKSIDKMNDSSEKTALLSRISYIEDVVEIENLTQKAISTQLISDMDTARTKIDSLSRGYMKDALMSSIKNVICFTPVKLESETGEEISSLENGNITVSVSAMTYDTNERTAQLIVGLYKYTNGYPQMICSAKSEKKELNSGEQTLISAQLNIDDISDGEYKLITFVWDDASGMLPLAAQTIIQ